MMSKINIALVGNPNSGKTSLFNNLTGLRQKIGNFPGITVDKKTGTCHISENLTAEIIDLPGTYSIYPQADDEYITFDVLCNKKNKLHPDLIIIVADGSNLKRTLLFCTQIIDLKIPVIIGLNMIDVAERNDQYIDSKKLETNLGVKVIPINARKGQGIKQLKNAIETAYQIPVEDFIDVHSLAPEVINEIKSITKIKSNYNAFQIACHVNNAFGLNNEEKEKIIFVLKKYGFISAKLQGEAILKRYEKITALLKATIKDKRKSNTKTFTDQLDSVLMHKFFGYFFMFIIFFLIFQAIFSWAELPMQFIETGFAQLEQWLHKILPQGMVAKLLTEGVLAGLSGICIFIPQIVILFGFITLMEDTGYMARVSFLMDMLMRKVGLNGKSVVPLMSGFACAIPAVMASRNIDNWKERLITIMVIPLMSCSARLPVYTILVSLVVPNDTVLGIFNLKGLTFMGLYLLGIISALVASSLLSLFITIKEKGYFIMEIPIYRMPRWGNVFITMIEKAKIFTVEAGRIILIISVILWVLASFGPGITMNEINRKYADPALTNQYSESELYKMMRAEKLTHSYAGLLGKWIEPSIQPLGFDWKIGIALISSLAAREVFVGTMATFYSVGSKDSDLMTLREKMKAEIHPETGLPFYTAAVAFSLLIFYVFAMQCISTLAVVKRETKSWKWPAVQFIFMTGLAYFASFVTYHLLR